MGALVREALGAESVPLASKPSLRARRAPARPPSAKVIELRASLERQLRRAYPRVPDLHSEPTRKLSDGRDPLLYRERYPAFGNASPEGPAWRVRAGGLVSSSPMYGAFRGFL